MVITISWKFNHDRIKKLKDILKQIWCKVHMYSTEYLVQDPSQSLSRQWPFHYYFTVAIAWYSRQQCDEFFDQFAHGLQHTLPQHSNVVIVVVVTAWGEGCEGQWSRHLSATHWGTHNSSKASSSESRYIDKHVRYKQYLALWPNAG